jgi:TRAP-type C4-dicarboxylate transport system permease small subunit
VLTSDITADDKHIKVDIFAPWIERHAPNFQRWIVHIFALGVYACLTFELGRHMLESLHSGKRTAVLDAPQWVMPAAATFFSLIGVVLFGAAIIATKGRLEKLTTPSKADDIEAEL